MTAVVDGRRVVSVSELQRAWRAVQAGKFRQESPTAAAQAPAIPAPPIWAPGNAEQVLPVVGCAGASGASTMALALASAAESSARVLECRSGTSGLAAASRLSSAYIRRVGAVGCAEMFYSKERAAFWLVSMRSRFLPSLIGLSR